METASAKLLHLVAFILNNTQSADKENLVIVDRIFDFVKDLPSKSHFMNDKGATNLDGVFSWIVKFTATCY